MHGVTKAGNWSKLPFAFIALLWQALLNRAHFKTVKRANKFVWPIFDNPLTSTFVDFACKSPPGVNQIGRM